MKARTRLQIQTSPLLFIRAGDKLSIINGMINIKKIPGPLFILFLIFWTNQNAAAGKIYQWRDAEGVMHFSSVPPEATSTKMAYKDTDEETVYQWKDEQGHMHYSDIPPAEVSMAAMREIHLEPFDDGNIDREKFSIINQAEQMSEQRKQREKERLAGKRAKLEKEKLAREMEMLRLDEFIRKHGYGPRPYYYPSSRPYDYFHPGHAYYRPEYP